MSLKVISAGPGLSIQDLGRAGHLASGVSRGGAMDRLALAEGAALLGQSSGLAALEMAGFGGRFEALSPLRIALTGAPMSASLAGAAVAWNASYGLAVGDVLDIGPALSGSFGYVHVGGGFDAPLFLGARAADLKSGIGRLIEAGDVLDAGEDAGGAIGLQLPQDDRFKGGELRLLPTAQTEDFGAESCTRLAATSFTRDPRSNRQAIQLAHSGPGFAVDGGLTVLSEITAPGDIQVTGDGVPFILVAEAQTTGGYPRIGTVLPADLPRAAQAPVGAALSFRWIDIDEALQVEREVAKRVLKPEPMVRDPRDMANLLAYGLIDGAVTGTEED